ncbi:MAG TPA: pilus assembly protein TadG-related protein [Pirellulales bacterium]|nr:pilus assembly protein TadG-related protein [Pirellulales bacterium]
MSARNYPSASDRAGNVTVLSTLLMVVFMGMAAFAVDLGYLNNSKAELQRTADAAALAAAWNLVYKGQPGTPIDLTSGIANARADAGAYASRNPVCSSAPAIGQSGDVVIGYMADPRQPGASMSFANQNQFNAVQVTVNRNATENGKVPYFFAKIFGLTGQATSAQATAALINNVGGFQVPSGASGSYNLPILPFAEDSLTIGYLMSGAYTASSGGAVGLTDDWSWNTSTGKVEAGSDGILEFNLFPQGTGSPGNRGTVNIGVTNNSTATVVQQILNGISAADLSFYPGGQLTFNSDGVLILPGNPGISAGFKSALASIIGQTRLIPVFSQVAGNGNNADFTIVQWFGIRVMDVNLTGSMRTKHLTVQPANVFVKQGIVPSTSGTQTSYAVYSPVWLVK